MRPTLWLCFDPFQIPAYFPYPGNPAVDWDLIMHLPVLAMIENTTWYGSRVTRNYSYYFLALIITTTRIFPNLCQRIEYWYVPVPGTGSRMAIIILYFTVIYISFLICLPAARNGQLVRYKYYSEYSTSFIL